MDENSNHSDELVLPVNEQTNRGSDSPMTLNYDSDSELHREDTLRFEESEEDEQSEKAFPVIISSINNDSGPISTSAKKSDSPGKYTAKTELDCMPKSKNKISPLIDSESDVEINIYKNPKKISKIIDSDNSDDQLSAKETHSGEKHLNIYENSGSNKISIDRLKSLVDSDSVSAKEDSNDESRKKKKLKTKKERGKGKTKHKTGDPKDLLASLNLDFSDEDSHPGKASSSSSNEERSANSDSDGENNIKTNKSRQKSSDDKPQRMSAKVAMEQMQVIQSESQRMAREANISVPYHRPKQHTLQEFLSRRTLKKSAINNRSDSSGILAIGRKKAAAAIKMTPEQLAVYAKQLEEREKEAMEFFKSERDEEPTKPESKVENISELLPEQQNSLPEQNNRAIETGTQQDLNTNPTDDIEKSSMELNTSLPETTSPKDTVADASQQMPETEEDALDALVNKTNENIELLLTSQAESESVTVIEKEPEIVAGPSTEIQRIDYDIFPEPTPSKLAQRKAELLSTGSITAFPTLKGNPNMIIDLDSDDQTLSGPDILFQRFAKCSGKKAKKPANLNILSTDKGAVELSTITLGLEHEERDPNGKEPIPGAAYTKLKQSLWEKMEQARRDSLRKRQEETKAAKKLDEDECENDEACHKDNEEEIENEEDIIDEEDINNDVAEEVNDSKRCELLDDEAGVDDEELEETEELNEDEGDDDGEESSGEESEVESEDQTVTLDGEKKKSRILAAFEDSDEENQGTGGTQPTSIAKNSTEELFPTLEGDKFTPSDRNNIETGDNMTLLWNDTEEPDTANTQAEYDLLALCSGRFGDTQAFTGTESIGTTQPMTVTPSDLVVPTQSDILCDDSEKPAATLFTQTSEHPVDDNELIALCSGTFATQKQSTENETEPQLPTDVIAKGKLVIVSSDEDNHERDTERKKRRKKHKQRLVNISDDEDSEEDTAGKTDHHDEESLMDEEEEVERFVDYDSEENEVEVVLTKKDKQKVISSFVENEAELSESEWGSADEDEKDLDRYDIELGDEEDFDQVKLQHELERIHLRRMLEQDKKEVKSLQDMFFEDEEKDGVGRERQFRWRNTETTFSLDYDQKTGDDEQKGEDGDVSDGEAEAQWRKMRYEREMLLKEKKVDLEKVNITGALLDETLENEVNENNASVSNTTLSMTKRKITIVRTKRCSEVNTPQDSPFLITKSSIVQGHKASFLSRDENTLNKLATLVKANPSTDGANTAAGMGKNFVFTSVSPAVDKMASKRSLDAETDERGHSAKKAKIGNSSTKENTTKKRLLLGHLM